MPGETRVETGAALSAAVASANPATPLQLVVPAGATMALTQRLTIQSNVSIRSSASLASASGRRLTAADSDRTIIDTRSLQETQAFAVGEGGMLELTGLHLTTHNRFKDEMIADGVRLSPTGGALLVEGGHAVLELCTFSDSAALEGGACAVTSGGSLTLLGCELLACTAHPRMAGGGVYVSGGDSRLIVTDTTIEGCVAGDAGGIVILNNGMVTMVNSVVKLCVAFHTAGALGVLGSTVTMIDSVIERCTGLGPAAIEGVGGVILTSNSHLITSGCRFDKCEATHSTCGGLVLFDSKCSATLRNTVFTECTAKSWGGAIINLGYLDAIGCSFVNCTAHSGGAYYGFSGQVCF